MKHKYSYGERFLCKYLFKHYGLVNHRDYIHPYVSKHHSWLRGKHLDFLFPKLHKAVEIQGGQHSHINSLNGNKSFITQQMSLVKELNADICKDDLCLHHGITVIPINVAFQRKSTIRRHIIDAVNKYIFLDNSNAYTYSVHLPNFKLLMSNKQKPSNTKRIKSYYQSLSLASQKLLNYLICSVNDDNLETVFNINNYIKQRGLSRSGTARTLIIKSLYQINHKDIINRIIDKSASSYLVVFNKKFKSYLINHSNNFYDIAMMHSRYSPMLYEIFCCNSSSNYRISEIKKVVGLESRYSSFSEFRRNVLKPVQNDINKYSHYNIHIKFLRGSGRGRQVKGIHVDMIFKNKSQLAQRNNLIYCRMHHIKIRVA